MKKYFLLPFIMIGLLFTSCQNDENNFVENPNKENLTLNNRIHSSSYFNDFNFEVIGIEHNNGLELIYQKFYNLNIENLSQEEINNTIFLETDLFISNNRNFDNFDNEILNFIRPNTNNISNEQFISELEIILLQDFSSQFIIDEFNKVNAILTNYASIENYSANQAVVELRLIENNIVRSEIEFDEIEYVAMRSFLSTCINSLTYWDKNFNKWTELNPNFQTMVRDWGWFKQSIKKMAVADAYGAGAGAVVGFFSSVASGPGVLIGTAAGAVGYGMNSSAVAGIRELLN